MTSFRAMREARRRSLFGLPEPGVNVLIAQHLVGKARPSRIRSEGIFVSCRSL